MYKIGVIGDRESILGFRAVGLTVFPCDEAEEAKKILKQIAKDDFAIIYVTEELYQYMGEDIKAYVDLRLPAVIPDGTLGIGMQNVRSAVERAVGADILFGGEAK